MKSMNILCRFLLKVSIVACTGCAASPEAAGFQKTYPWTWTPYTGAPWIYKPSFNDIIDLEHFYLNNDIRNNKKQQDAQCGYPVNALTDSLRKQY